MTTLVTGATGFVGGNLARALWARGEDVRALVRPTANDLAIRDTGVAQVTGDLLDSESVRRATEGCETVYHCAATYSFWSPRPREVYRSNVTGTENLLDAARRAGVRRVVFTSSVSTIGIPDHGPDDTERLGTEEMPPRPALLIGHYKQSKYATEQIALAANDDEMEVVVVNPCAPVGEWDVKPTPTGQIPLSFARGKAPGYIATGMNLVDVSDVAEGHILAMERGAPGERYILGCRNLTLKEIFDLLSEITGRPAPKIRIPHWAILGIAYLDEFVEGALLRRPPAVPVEAIKITRHPMYVSCSKAVSELGLPQSPVEAALEKAVRWFRDYGYI
ncbi:MAG: NAD-dependent epimerase/dehydratase family protein [Chloroflexota bacterium]|nr:NAD-dependent epimerase/dehydratase family protein [Chloroflexota bacterium]MDE2961060.1 NAD-dependent epimerase/dehydratase family protein [Chloroflexota bacterium]